ncbi:RNA-directed DNA polymerase, eukaryota, reverse transcriptase zinc-binding domain protein [Tanacetum coccineum]
MVVLEELLKLPENTECAIAKPSMTMTKENGNGVQVTHAGRIRWRKGSNEAISYWFAFQDNIEDNAPNSATLASAMLDECPLELEAIRCNFFNGHEEGSHKASWTKWNNVLADKCNGGLGVSSLFAFNRGLMMKWMWRFYSYDTSLWSNVIKAIHGDDGNVNLTRKSGMRSSWSYIVNEAKALEIQGVNVLDNMHLKLGDGTTSLFWKDNWSGKGSLKTMYHRLYSHENQKKVSVRSKMNDISLVHSFHHVVWGRGVEQSQFDALSSLVRSINLVPMCDRWVWTLESSGIFSVASIRKIIDGNRLATSTSKTRWIKYVPIKANVLAWKVKMDALPTRFNISRRGIVIPSLTCPTCDNGIETSDHLFFKCDMSRHLASNVSSGWSVNYADINSYNEWCSWITTIRLKNKTKAMLEGVFYTMWWYILNFRNKLLF